MCFRCLTFIFLWDEGAATLRLRGVLVWCYASLDSSEYIILRVHFSPIVDYYENNVIPCYVLLIAFQEKKYDAAWRASSKDGIAAIRSHQDAINK